MLTSEGYPGSYEKGREIAGLEQFADWQDGAVFHAGTQRQADALVTNGGRVLGVTATGADIRQAIATTYQAVQRISWPGMHYRRDIGQRALAG